MIRPLLLHDWRENRTMFLFFTGVVLMYGTISISMFDPESAQAMEDMLALMPDTLINMMGFSGLGTELTGYLGNYLYGFILLMFPILFITLVSNRLISRHVDTGSMPFLLNTPHSRREIAFTQYVFLITAVFAILLIHTTVMLVMAAFMFPSHLDVGGFLRLNLVLLGVHVLFASLTYLIGILLADNSAVIGWSGGILFGQFLLHMISRIGDSVSFFRFTTILSLVDVDWILEEPLYSLIAAALVLVAAAMIAMIAIRRFEQKSLVI
jgi:ABC-2 type transport system permease protein